MGRRVLHRSAIREGPRDDFWLWSQGLWWVFQGKYSYTFHSGERETQRRCEKSKVTQHLPGLGWEKYLSRLCFPLTTDIIFKIFCYKPPNSLKYGKDLTTSLFYATSPQVLSNTSPQRFASHIMWILFMDLFISRHTFLDPWRNRKGYFMFWSFTLPLSAKKSFRYNFHVEKPVWFGSKDEKEWTQCSHAQKFRY